MTQAYDNSQGKKGRGDKRKKRERNQFLYSSSLDELSEEPEEDEPDSELLRRPLAAPGIAVGVRMAGVFFAGLAAFVAGTFFVTAPPGTFFLLLPTPGGRPRRRSIELT